MDDYSDQERPLKKNHTQQLYTDNVFTYDVEDPNSID